MTIMTIAYDRTTGKIMGQVLANPAYDVGPDYVRVLNARGYADLARETVRLVWVSDR